MLSNKTLLVLTLLSSACSISTGCDTHQPTTFSHNGVNYMHHNGIYYHDQKKSSLYEILVMGQNQISAIIDAITTVAKDCPATELKSLEVDHQNSKITVELHRYRTEKLDIFAVALKNNCENICPVTIKNVTFVK